MTSVSISQIGTFQTCPRKWYYQYVEGLRSVTQNGSSLQRGDVFHKVMAVVMHTLHYGYNGCSLYGMSSDELIRAVKSVANTTIEELKENRTENALPDKINMWGEEIILDEVEYPDYTELADTAVKVFMDMRLYDYSVVVFNGTPLIEYLIEQPIDADTTFVGVIDVVLQHKVTGDIFVVDWKTRRSFQGNESIRLDQQLPLYCAVLQMQGIVGNLVEAVQVQVKPKMPAVPRLNKDGTMSRQKISTDWTTYELNLRAAGLDPNDYVDMVEKCNYEFMRVNNILLNKPVLTTFWLHFIQSVSVLTHARKTYQNDFSLYPAALNKTCSDCPFAGLCDTIMYGGDYDHYLSERYTTYDERMEIENAV